MVPVTLELITLALKTVANSDATKKLAEAAAKAIADWDIHKVAKEAVISGSGAIAQGPGGVAAGAGGVAVVGDVAGPIHTGSGDVMVGADVVSGDKIAVKLQDITDSEIQVAGRDIVGDTIEVARGVTVSYETAFEKVASSTAFVLNQLELNYNQTREQSQTWFRFSIIAAGLGFVLVGIGVVAVIFEQLTEGLITTISSVVPNTVAALFFLQSKASNERVDATRLKLTEAREVQTAVEIANTIETKKARDGLKAEIVRKVLRLEKADTDK